VFIRHFFLAQMMPGLFLARLTLEGTVLPGFDCMAEAMDFMMDVYRTNKTFPRDET
jgi:hypothetical protein